MPPETPVGRDQKGLWLPLVFLMFGLLITLAALHQTQRFIQQEQQAEFDAYATRVRNDLSMHTYRHVDILRTYQAEFAAHPYFFDDGFKRMAQVLRLEARLPGVVSAGYVRRVASDLGPDQYVLHYFHGQDHTAAPASSARDTSLPAQSGDIAHSLELESNPLLFEAIHRARDLGDIAATAPLLPAYHPEKVFKVFLPLYRGGLIPDTAQQRQQSFEGAMFVAIDPVRLLESLPEPGVINTQPARLEFDSYIEANGLAAAKVAVFDNTRLLEAHSDRAHASLPFAMGGTQWVLHLGMPAADARSQRWLPWSILATGLLLSLLSAIVIIMLQRSRTQSLQRATEDRSLRREAETALLLRQRAIEASANAIVIANATKRGYPVEYVNPAFERMTGYSAEEVIGQSMRVMHAWDKDQAGLEKLKRILAEKREGQATLRNYRKDGELYWTRVHLAPVRDDSGAVTHFVAAKYDITQTRRYQETLEFQAWHDALTQLPNRHALRARLTDAILNAKPGDAPFWVAFLDLDNFKLMNDSLGHTLGDLALQEIARRLQKALHEEDMVARRGGDEFVFILFDHAPPRNALATLQRIMSAVSRPLRLESQRFHPSCSVGVAVHPQDGDDPEVLIKHADMAMYHAKAQGRNNFQFFSSALTEQAMERVKMEADLRAALERGEFELHYQPQLRLHDDTLTSMEALVRWHHPERGLVSPTQFIPLAEETGLIVPLGEWILREACKQVAAWRDAGYPPLRMAVNLSARQFKDKNLTHVIRCVLQDSMLDPKYLELELTESLLAEDVEAANLILQKLKSLGVVLSLDDFGTGYSSLAQLKRFPLDILKIDRSFISDISVEHSSSTIVRTIIKMAHSLDLTALAEGVETEEQKRFLQDHGCDAIQGYLVSRPMPAAAFEAWMRQHLRR